jgi:hypothetical protein
MILGSDTAFWNQVTGPKMLGMSPANGAVLQTPTAGASLPSSTVTGGDNAMLPWSPDSPTFWLVLIAGATVFGIAGASFRVRVGKGHAGANLGAT